MGMKGWRCDVLCGGLQDWVYAGPEMVTGWWHKVWVGWGDGA